MFDLGLKVNWIPEKKKFLYVYTVERYNEGYCATAFFDKDTEEIRKEFTKQSLETLSIEQLCKDYPDFKKVVEENGK